MKKFKIVPVSETYAAEVRETGVDSFGHKITVQVATGKGPCRVSLKPFIKGEDERILISHSPFEIDNAYNQPGPVFINKKPVEAYKDIYSFPPEIKADKKSFPISLVGYNTEQFMVFTQLVGENDIDLLIAEIFDKHPEVHYLHARNSQACCFICKIERVSESE